MTDSLRILHVEDSVDDAKLIAHAMQRAQLRAETERVHDEAGMREALSRGPWDAIISDWAVPGFGALDALALVQELGIDIPFIVVSGAVGEDVVVDAMRRGVDDYVLKENLRRLAPAIEREVRDVGMRREHRLREAHFMALCESSNEAVVMTDSHGRWTYASANARTIFGAPSSELVGKSMTDFVHENDRVAVLTALGRHCEAADDRTPVTLREFRIRRNDGSIRWLEVTCTNRLSQPTVHGVVVNVHDVTGRNADAAALRASEARFARLAESNIVGIFTAGPNGKIIDANDSYLQMIGCSREQLAADGVAWQDHVASEHVERMQACKELLLATGSAPAFETVLVAKDGRRVPALVGAAILEGGDCLTFCVDLTEKKRAETALQASEEHLRQAQKMEAIGRLAGGVAHDFNNVLSVILSYSDLLLAELPATDPMRADVSEIHVAGKRAAALTRQLLIFSRQHVVMPQILDLNEVLTNLDKMLHRLIGEDVELVSLRPRPVGMIKADPSSIEQIIMNLVVNARDAMPTGGSLTIETANVVLGPEHLAKNPGAKLGPCVMLSVSDTGAGMDEATLSHAFEPFFTTKPQDRGTGLGLSTVLGIVQQSGGSVSVETELGQGTTFRIYLPCVEGTAQPSRSLTSMQAVRGTETVLLVEDEEVVRRVAHEILERAGYKVIAASNAGEALLVCEQHAGPIDLLVTDVVMPRMSGPELAKRLGVLRPQMKVLLMSGYTDDSMLRHGAHNSDVAFLQKPLTRAALTQRVREVLDSPAG